MVKMEVFGLALDEKNQAPVLILKPESGEVVVPIWIGAMEGMAISLALNQVSFPRPMTHDLLLSAVTRLGGEVERAEIVGLEGGAFFAEIVLRQGDRTVRVDSRPSDAVAVALRAKAPVFAAAKVIEKAGTRAPEFYQAALRSQEAEKWTEELEKFVVSETKYKM